MTKAKLPLVVLLCALLAGAFPVAVAAQDSTDAYLAFLLARRLEAEGDNQGALRALERAAASDPTAAEIRAEMASFHLRQNEREPAERAARAALELDPDNVGANRALGLIYSAVVDESRDPAVQASAMRDAITYLERAVANSRINVEPVLQYTLGRLYIRNGQSAKAVEALGAVLRQNPFSVQGRLSMAEAYASSGDLDGAIATLEEVLEDQPRVAAALGQYQEAAGQYSAAAESYTLALAVQPRSRELKARRIAVLLDAGDYGRAVEFAADARRQHPDDSRFVRLHGRALFDAGDRSGAIALLEQASKTSPVDTGTLYTLADVYRDAGRGADAERALRQIIGLEPTNANALNYLGYLLALRGGELDEAVDLVERALAQEPDNGAYLDSLGWAHFKRGDLDLAEKYLSAAAERLPRNSEVQDHLGDVFAGRGRLAEAVAAWTRALEGDGQDIERTAVERKISDARAKLLDAR